MILNGAGLPGYHTISMSASGAIMFPGILNFSFNVQNGIYFLSLSGGTLNAFIDIWSTGFRMALLINSQAVTST